MNQNESLALARHEAGHAVAAHLLGVEVFSVELRGDGGQVYHDGPDTLLGKGQDAASVAIVHCKIAVAGRAASPATEYSASDNDGARMAHWLGGAADVDWLTFRDACHERVAQLLSDHEPEIARVAAVLIERGAMTGAEFRQVLADMPTVEV